MRSRSLLLILPLLLSACAGAAAPFGIAATPSLTARERVEAQLRKENGTGTTTDAAGGLSGSAGAPASVAGAPQQLPNTATSGDATDATRDLGVDPTGPVLWDGAER
ncbi:MAG: hypothetical protein ABR525_01530 [Candidatus Limnocylindria bacterium]